MGEGKKFLMGIGLVLIVSAILFFPDLNAGVPAPAPEPKQLGIDFGPTIKLVGTWVATILLFSIGAAGSIRAMAWAKHSWTTQIVYPENGQLPTLVVDNTGIRDRKAGRTQRALFHLQNAGVSAQQVTVDLAGQMDVNSAEDWTGDNQKLIASMAQRTRMQTGAYGREGVRNKSQAFLAAGGDPNDLFARRGSRAPEMAAPDNSGPVILPKASALDGLKATSETAITVGYNVMPDSPRYAVNDLVQWDVKRRAHARFHGETQSGKTTMTATAIVNMIAAGWSVVIADRRDFKDYRAFEGHAELVATKDPADLLRILQNLTEIHEERDAMVGAAGAGNIDNLGERKPRRIGLVIDEFGTQMLYAKRAGLWDAINDHLFTLTAEAASNGIHLLITDQKPTSDMWDAHVRANIGFVLTGYMPKGSGQSAGHYSAYELGNYEFALGDEAVIKTWPIRENWRHYESAMPVNLGSVLGERITEHRAPQLPKHPDPDPGEDGPTDLQAQAVRWLERKANEIGKHNVRPVMLQRAMEGKADRSYLYKLWRRWADGDPAMIPDSGII